MWVNGVRHKNLMPVNGMGGKLAFYFIYLFIFFFFFLFFWGGGGGLRFRALIFDDPSHVQAIPATVYTIPATAVISIISTY